LQNVISYRQSSLLFFTSISSRLAIFGSKWMLEKGNFCNQ
jgi:hypothetical protein